MFDWLDAGAHLGQHPGGGAAPSLVFERWLLAGLRPSARLGFVGRPADTLHSGLSGCRRGAEMACPSRLPCSPLEAWASVEEASAESRVFLVCYMSAS